MQKQALSRQIIPWDLNHFEIRKRDQLS
jgi:hypothetical protein